MHNKGLCGSTGKMPSTSPTRFIIAADFVTLHPISKVILLRASLDFLRRMHDIRKNAQREHRNAKIRKKKVRKKVFVEEGINFQGDGQTVF